MVLRPGNAGSNTAADHLTVVDAAVAQIPAKSRRRMLFTDVIRGSLETVWCGG